MSACEIIRFARASNLASLALNLTLLLSLFNTGVIPATLSDITKETEITITQQGSLGSLVFIGLTVMSLFAGSMMQNYRVSHLIGGATIANGITMILFGTIQMLR